MSNNPFDNLPIISSYTSDEAEADGMLVPIPGIKPVEAKWYVTAAVFAEIEEKSKGKARTPLQALMNLAADAVAFINQPRQQAQRRCGETLFTDDFARHMEGNITGQKLWIGMNEHNGWTIMFPSDY